MAMNDTPAAERTHIAFFGRRNAGKSSLINAVTGQELAVVSDQKGTTTDPVYKSMELLPLGPVVVIDTPGYDDEGELGELRVKKTKQVLNRCDLAVLVVDALVGIGICELELMSLFREKELPYLVVYNKADLNGREMIPEEKTATIYVSAKTGEGVFELKERMAKSISKAENEKRIIADKLQPDDLVVLVVPIDEAAPKGRLILPQQQTIRDILDAEAIPVVTKDTKLTETLESLVRKPAMVITDSQIFGKVSKLVPEDIPLTSFSILMARYKGFLDAALEGAAVLKILKDGDKVLISEGCTHHRQCGDIGTVKLPKLIRKTTGIEPQFFFTSGKDFPEDVSEYRLVIHCGGCMLTERELQYRKKSAKEQGVPFTNYGIALASMNGILERSVALF